MENDNMKIQSKVKTHARSKFCESIIDLETEQGDAFLLLTMKEIGGVRSSVTPIILNKDGFSCDPFAAKQLQRVKVGRVTAKALITNHYKAIDAFLLTFKDSVVALKSNDGAGC